MDLSTSSKHLLFLSFQRRHIKQWGMILHLLFDMLVITLGTMCSSS